MANKDLPDNENTFAVDAPDVEGADGGWDDWDDELDVDVPSAEADLSADELDVDVPDVAPAAKEVYDVAEAPDEDWADDDWGNDDSFDDDELDVDVGVEAAEAEETADEEAEDVPLQPAEVAVEPSVEEPSPAVEEVVEEPSQQAEEEIAPEAEPIVNAVEPEQSAEETEAAIAEQEAEPVQEVAAEPQEEAVAAIAEEGAEESQEDVVIEEAPAKSAEELQREQEELEAYRDAMGESNAEMADISEYRTFRKKTKTESKSSVPKKSDFDLFANRYKVKTMNAMVAASDPIVYFYNACLRADGSIVAFNVYQVLQDRFIGKMIPQLFTAVAENSSKIEDLNEANLIEQLKVCAEYPQYDFIISISARFFTKPALLERFLKLVPEGGVPNLVLAFDCSSLENIAIAAKAGLGAVRQKGVKILLDNTERVTMTVLSEFDYDIIRIDSRYYEIGNPRAEAYLRLLLQLTKSEGVTSIATFCDSEDLSEYMFFMGVDAIQGNATSRPMRTVPNAVKAITLLPSMLDA